ncbi:MAG: matrixin family metalloprotease [Vampirovibrionales bacterium]|nr:matrixin family metalloprotease [Vampirovibrionales bacterium]
MASNTPLPPLQAPGRTPANSTQINLSRPQPGTISLEAVLTPDSGQSASVRWRANRMPLVVYMEPLPESSSATYTASDANALLEEALKAWQNASITPHLNPASAGIGFRRLFQPPEDNSKPDILFRWVSETVLGRTYETGHARRELETPVTSSSGFMTHVEITLVDCPVIDAHLSSQQRLLRLQATLLHEIGHALGLEHALAKTDVMYYQGWRNTILSPGDIAALQALYAPRANRLA